MKSDALIEWHDLVRGDFFAKVIRFAAMVQVAGIEYHAHVPNLTPPAELVRALDARSVSWLTDALSTSICLDWQAESPQ